MPGDAPRGRGGGVAEAERPSFFSFPSYPSLLSSPLAAAAPPLPSLIRRRCHPRKKNHPPKQKTHQNPPPQNTTKNNSGGGGAGGQAAKDALGNDVKENEWLATHPKNTRQLTQGLKGDPTYLIVNADAKIESYGLNAVCTHLGCVVPWVGAENKFKCPCHGSQYNAEGKVIRGPAPLSLALAHCAVNEAGLVTFSPWTETDFRTGLNPWWK